MITQLPRLQDIGNDLLTVYTPPKQLPDAAVSMQGELLSCLRYVLSHHPKMPGAIDDTQAQLIGLLASFITDGEQKHQQRLDIDTTDDYRCQQMLMTHMQQYIGTDNQGGAINYTERRRKTPISVLKKLIREPKYIPCIVQYGRLPDRQGMTFFFPSRETLMQAVLSAKEGLKHHIIEEIDIGVFGRTNATKESLITASLPLYILGIGEETAAWGEIAFKIDHRSQCDFVYQKLQAEAIIADEICHDALGFRRCFFGNLVSFNHPVFRMIQDVNVYKTISDDPDSIHISSVVIDAYRSIYKLLVTTPFIHPLLTIAKHRIERDRYLIQDYFVDLISQRSV